MFYRGTIYTTDQRSLVEKRCNVVPLMSEEELLLDGITSEDLKTSYNRVLIDGKPFYQHKQ